MQRDFHRNEGQRDLGSFNGFDVVKGTGEACPREIEEAASQTPPTPNQRADFRLTELGSFNANRLAGRTSDSTRETWQVRRLARLSL
jgi:hypothetical protein